MILNKNYEAALDYVIADPINCRMTSPTNVMNHQNNINIRRKLQRVLPLEKGDILICNRTSQIWPVLNGDRVRVEDTGEDFKISLLLPGKAVKTEVWLKSITVRSLETEKV